MSESERTQRLFFALWPDDATRHALTRLLRTVPRKKGKPVSAEKLHITLVFLGSVGADTRHCMETKAAHVHLTPFSLSLSQLGYFGRSKVLWIGPQTCPEQLSYLVEQLNACLAPCGYRAEPRAYHPHLTLLRKALPAVNKTPVEPVHWHVDGFCLVESVMHPEGAQYKVLRRYTPPV